MSPKYLEENSFESFDNKPIYFRQSKHITQKNNISLGLDSPPRTSLSDNPKIDRQDGDGPPDIIPNLQSERHFLDNQQSIARSKNKCDQSILPCRSMVPIIKPFIQIIKVRWFKSYLYLYLFLILKIIPSHISNERFCLLDTGKIRPTKSPE